MIASMASASLGRRPVIARQPSSVTTHHVFDAHAEALVRQVKAGLDGKHHAALQFVFRRTRIVDVQADMVGPGRA